MRPSLFLFIFLVVGVSKASSEKYTIDKQIYEGSSVEFLQHQGNGKFDNYLSMNLPFAPMKALFSQVQANENVELKNRGEAHITVVTPIEYWEALRPHQISMQEINDIASKYQIQDSKFEVVCLGRGVASINGKTETTYFAVVKSQDLIKIRQEIFKIFLSKGGSKAEFDPDRFFSHITIGFTNRDLHEQDGVIKDERSCIGDIGITSNN